MGCLDQKLRRSESTLKEAQKIPLHVAIIMDGNGRWAQERHMPRKLGHYKGAENVRSLIAYCDRKGVKCVTLFAFSTENWNRPAEEVDALMLLFIEYLDKELPLLLENQVRFRVIGSLDRFSVDVRHRIEAVQNQSERNTGLVLNIAANYGGRWDIVQAVQRWMAENPNADMCDFTQEALSNFLSTADQPELDLVIRTGGESRISNFLLWQAAYAEIYFTDKLWPDFDESSLELAFKWFATRNRRFGTLMASPA
jgi:undecaprenyl diphosphate synthase